MITEDVLRKIKKCLALAESDNPGEAANAMRQAQKLMALHNVTEGVLKRDAVRESYRQGTRGQKPAKWESAIVWTCCEAFGARPLWSAGPKGGTGDRDNGWWTFVGPESAIALVDYTYTVLVRQLLKARAEHSAQLGPTTSGYTRVRKAADLDAFCEAYAAQLRAKVQAVTLPEGVQEHVDRIKNPNGKPVTPTNNGRGSVWSALAGAEEGAKAHFHRPVKQEERAKIKQ